jgi:hypothetical protein
MRSSCQHFAITKIAKVWQKPSLNEGRHRKLERLAVDNRKLQHAQTIQVRSSLPARGDVSGQTPDAKHPLRQAPKVPGAKHLRKDTMEASERGRIYTESIGCKVASGVARLVEERASEQGLKVSEWIRNAITDALKEGSRDRTVLAELRTVLAELMALRTVLLTLKKERWRQAGELTDELLDAISDAAEARKFAQADARILAGKGK